MLSRSERTYLIATARKAATDALRIKAPDPGPLPGERLNEPGMAFVTWKRDGRLHGCIGSIEATRPLVEDVRSHAVNALMFDPRFSPATAREFPGYRVEISVLSPREKITGPEEIEIGRHGLIVDKGGRRGLLLPQVAPEWGWDASKLLEQVCLKAGLPQDAWKTGHPAATVYRFEAEVFGEEENRE